MLMLWIFMVVFGILELNCNVIFLLGCMWMIIVLVFSLLVMVVLNGRCGVCLKIRVILVIWWFNCFFVCRQNGMLVYWCVLIFRVIVVKVLVVEFLVNFFLLSSLIIFFLFCQLVVYWLWLVVWLSGLVRWVVESILIFLVCNVVGWKLIGFFIVVSVSSCMRWFWMILWVVLMLL